MKISNNHKNDVKILLFDSIYFYNDDYLILANLFNLIDSIDDLELKKIKLFLENNHHIKTLEKNKNYWEISNVERSYKLRLSSVIMILILIRIVAIKKNEEIRFLINKYIEQENYRHLMHQLDYIEKNLLRKILNSINLKYENEKSIFFKLKKYLINCL